MDSVQAATNLQRIQSQLAEMQAGHVRIIAVSKTHPPHSIRTFLEAGQRDFGENRQNEAREKFPLVKTADLALDARPIYHHIGPLQSSAARQVAGLFHFVHGVSSWSGLKALQKACLKFKEQHDINYVLKYLIQLNLTGESSKAGGMSADILAEYMQSNPDLPENEACKPVGFMTMGPTSGDTSLTRAVFKNARLIRDRYLPAGELSMGMSADWKIAVEEGATMIRLGSTLFGRRGSAPWKPTDTT